MGQSEEKRKLIIDAAVAEFQENGFERASMDRVASRAQVSKRTVYNHFSCKDALFHAILDLMTESCNAAFVVKYDPARPIRDQLFDLGWAEGKLITSPDFMRIAKLVIGESMRNPELAANLNCRLERLIIFTEFVADAHADGALHAPDAKRAADQFVGLIKAQAFWPAIHQELTISREEMETIVETSVEMFLKFYEPQQRSDQTR